MQLTPSPSRAQMDNAPGFVNTSASRARKQKPQTYGLKDNKIAEHSQDDGQQQAYFSTDQEYVIICSQRWQSERGAKEYSQMVLPPCWHFLAGGRKRIVGL